MYSLRPTKSNTSPFSMSTASSSQCKKTARRLARVTPNDSVKREDEGCAIRGVDEPSIEVRI